MTILVGMAVCTGPTWSQVPDEDWDDRPVEASMKRAVAHLWAKQKDGHWPWLNARVMHGNVAGPTALVTYALLAAGESGQDPRMLRAVEYLAAAGARSTYTRALRANVWAMLRSNSKYRKYLAEDVKYLVDGVDERGGYDYVPMGRGRAPRKGDRFAMGRPDNSNSQLAVLGVWAGQECGVDVPLLYWRLVRGWWKGVQQDDGGWAYQGRGRSYGSMTVAGLATMFICFDVLHHEQFVRCEAETDYPPITRGLAWLDKNFTVDCNPSKGMAWYYYYLYGVERVGLASGYKYFGKKDWYKLGAKALLERQRLDGGWGSVTDTAFALLFLAGGRHPVLFNKLRYAGSWNCRPRDLANLTRWVSGQFERPVNWQIVHLGAPVRELHDAPILYISGASAPRFSDEEVAKLRQYVLQGGAILSEAACSKASFTLAMGKVYARMFPEYELKRLPADHPVYSLHFKVDPGRRALWGISNGVRLLALHSPSELSLAWQMRQHPTDSDAFKLGANVYLYVTDKGILPPRGVVRWPVAKPLRPVETLRVARVKFAGQADPEPLAWRRFAIDMANRHAVKVEVSAPTAPAQLDPAAWPVAAMTGVASFTLSDADKAGLAKYLAGGGTLVVDAAGGSAAFAESAEKQLGELLSDADMKVLPGDHRMFTQVGPRVDKVAYRRALRATLADKSRPRLRAWAVKGRAAIIFSTDDLTAGLVGYPRWGLKGYEPDSAFALMRNILLYASGKKLAQPRRPAPAPVTGGRRW